MKQKTVLPRTPTHQQGLQVQKRLATRKHGGCKEARIGTALVMHEATPAVPFSTGSGGLMAPPSNDIGSSNGLTAMTAEKEQKPHLLKKPATRKLNRGCRRTRIGTALAMHEATPAAPFSTGSGGLLAPPPNDIGSSNGLTAMTAETEQQPHHRQQQHANTSKSDGGATPAKPKHEERRKWDHLDSAAAQQSPLLRRRQRRKSSQSPAASERSQTRCRGDRSEEYARQKLARNEKHNKELEDKLEAAYGTEMPEDLFRSKKNLDKITRWATLTEAPFLTVPHPPCAVAASFELAGPLEQLLRDSAQASRECRKQALKRKAAEEEKETAESSVKEEQEEGTAEECRERGLKREAAEEEQEAAEIRVKEEQEDGTAEEEEQNEEAEDDKDELIRKLRIDNQRLQDDNRRFVRRAHRLARLNRRYVDWSLQGIKGF
jgi:hypothetical protein